MNNRVLTIILASSVGFLAIAFWFIRALDDWLGILAFESRYLVFVILASAAVGCAWFARSRRAGWSAVLVACGVLLSPYLWSRPSARILRGMMEDVPLGMNAERLEEMVEEAYRDTGYVMPGITKRHDRVHVSLLTQDASDCTAAIFHVQNGLVVRTEFSAD